MADLFKGRTLYEGGNVNSTSNSLVFFNSVWTGAGVYVGGIPQSMYDGSITTYYEVYSDGSPLIWTWKLDQTKKFKNVYLTFGYWTGSLSTTFLFQGSKNNVDWTTLWTKTTTAITEIKEVITLKEINYRYFRLYASNAGGGGRRINYKMYNMDGVI